MKFQKLFFGIATTCLLVGASGAAMAATVCNGNDIPEDGFLKIGHTVGNVEVTGNCVIVDWLVVGNVIANLGPDDTLVMYENVVLGKIKVTGGSAALKFNILPGGHVTGGNATSGGGNRIVIDSVDNDTVVTQNLLQGPGNIVVRSSSIEGAQVLIEGNTVTRGDIRCEDLEDATASGNTVPRGKTTCSCQCRSNFPQFCRSKFPHPEAYLREDPGFEVVCRKIGFPQSPRSDDLEPTPTLGTP